jgi:hypothetical protein
VGLDQLTVHLHEEHGVVEARRTTASKF